ncbi:pyridine nucleotide-disulfide oxidoreductase family protein [Rhodopirellula baltica SH28]|uniref:Pyridine nucleotide-disulfide oxidoreductase family protein n=2 Tax=Rhodopirellula baltica TaxID=265606 RepID=K5DA14_RHOBT|nr:pyridine nucleotide-disulfide oxidoreductase family protein [Rhodopirellula baltica SH28]
MFSRVECKNMNSVRKPPTQKKIVLLGIGHTNAHVLKQWADHPIAHCDLICISPFPVATYSGMLPGTLGEQFTEEEMQIDLRAMADQAGATLIIAKSTSIDLDTNQIHFSDHVPVSFDVLSIGIGSMPAGWNEHESPLIVPTKPMQTFLRRLSERIDCVDDSKSTNKRVAIVGGGVASIEIALCLHEHLRKQGRLDRVQLDLFSRSPSVSDELNARSQETILQLLAARNIQTHFNSAVTEIGDDSLTTSEGKTLPFDAVVWATGAAPPTILHQTQLDTDDHGFVATFDTLQSLSHQHVFSVGDAGTIVRNPAPKAGVTAVRQSPILWHNLRAFVAETPLKRFRSRKTFLKILNTGDGKGLLDYGWFSFHARWCWTLKTWIDRRFIRQFPSP